MSAIAAALPPILKAEATSTFVPYFKKLASLLRLRRLQFLCGAGLSCESGGPSFRELALLMLQELFQVGPGDKEGMTHLRRLVSTFDPTGIAEVCQKGGVFKTDFKEFLRDRLSLKTSRSHEILGIFASKGWIERLYTTNFDALIEDGIGKVAIPVTDNHLEELRRAEAKEIPTPAIIHLHNDLGGDYLITEKDLVVRGLDSPLLKVFQADLARSAFVFLGYSLSDPNLKSIYLKTNEELERCKQSKATFVVAPLERPEMDSGIRDVDEFLHRKWKVAKALWESRGATLIPMTAKDFLENLLDTVKEVGLEAKRRELEERLGDKADKRPDLVKITLDAHVDMKREDEALDFLLSIWH